MFCYISLIWAKSTCWFSQKCQLSVLSSCADWYQFYCSGGTHISFNLLLFPPNTVENVWFHTRIVSVLLAQSTVENKGNKAWKKKIISPPPPLRTIYINSLFLCYKIWNACVTSWCSRHGVWCRNFTPRDKRIKSMVHPVVVHPELKYWFRLAWMSLILAGILAAYNTATFTMHDRSTWNVFSFKLKVNWFRRLSVFTWVGAPTSTLFKRSRRAFVPYCHSY